MPVPPYNNPRGFTPSGHLTGNFSPSMRRRRTNGRNLRTLRVGDPVYLDANGDVQRALVATAVGQQWIGVIGMLFNENGRPLQGALPSALAASTVGFAGVYEDPFIIYTVHSSAAVGDATVGLFANIAYQNTGTAAGISSCSLADDFTATSIGHPLKVIGVSRNLLEENASGTARNDVEVIITQHKWLGRGRAILVEEHAA